MPIHGYPGNIITANPTAPTSSVASGVWTTEQQLAAKAAGNWPTTIPAQQISRSLRFNSADSTYLNKTFSTTPTNRAKKTVSCWYKRSNLSSTQNLFSSYNGSGQDGLFLNSSDSLQIYAMNGGAGGTVNGVLRDVSAWYHIVYVIDTTQATAGDRLKIWINGVNFPSGSWTSYSAPSLNSTADILFFQSTEIGRDDFSSSGYLNGYLAETYFVDGQALTPSSFGQTNASTGVWEPIAYSGTYGTNGFYLNFSDNSGTTSTTLGKDYSGNGNNWTPNNFSVTAGAGNDSLVDTPTNYGTDTGVGGEVRGNYCTFNAAMQYTLVNGTVTLSNGNLTSTDGGTTYGLAAVGTIAVSSGKWYWEVTATSVGGSYGCIGVVIPSSISGYLQTGIIYASNGNKSNAANPFTGAGFTAYGASYTSGDIIGIALDIDNGTIVFYKNGVSQGTAYSTGISGNTWTIGVGDGQNATSYTYDLNCGQRPFAYTPPAGFLSLCSTNLPTPTIGFGLTNQGDDYFNAVTYTGNGGTQTVSGVGFQPDLVWIKSRSGAYNNWLNDSVRGAGYSLSSNTTAAEDNYTAYFTSFTTDGYTVAGGTNGFNANTATYVAWNWKANGSGSSNTAGSITSTVSANTTSGFSIATFTQLSGSPYVGTVGHGLGVAPSMVIIKDRSMANGWLVYHASLGATKYLVLNSTAAAATGSNAFNNTAPTSTVFTTAAGSTYWGNAGATAVAYCFAAVAGYSAFGSYTGNGSEDGPFVYCGFRPRYVLIKRTDSTGWWHVWDTARNTYNLANLVLFPNDASAEATYTAPDPVIDILSNGFKNRGNYPHVNASGGTYIYAAFAESPFKFANAR